MSTPFSEIYDLTLVSFRDYKIDQVYNTSLVDFENIMKGYLLKAIPKFTGCKKDISTNIDTVNNTFADTLSLDEKVILSDLTLIEWMTSKILDVTQMQLHLNTTDFKTYAESQNLKAKIDTQNILRERVSQDMTNYGVKNIPWTDWMAGNYG